jgi:hypothetical protein
MWNSRVHRIERCGLNETGVASQPLSSSKKRRHERLFVRAGRPVTQLVCQPGILGRRSGFKLSFNSDALCGSFVAQKSSQSELSLGCIAKLFPNTVTQMIRLHKSSTQFYIFRAASNAFSTAYLSKDRSDESTILRIRTEPLATVSTGTSYFADRTADYRVGAARWPSGCSLAPQFAGEPAPARATSEFLSCSTRR